MERDAVAVVTGASRGIGHAIASRLAARGLSVVNIDREKPTEAAPFRFVEADLADAEAARAAFETVARDRPILWLVNNAGISPPASLEETTVEHIDQVVAINLRAVIIGTQVAAACMREAGFGRIVSLSSRAALGKELRTTYAATKAGVIGMTRTWALELGPFGITANAIGPGPIGTELFWSANPHNDPRTQAIVRGVPVGRMGTPEDIAHAAAFFLSDEASFVTGQVLYVCGGISVGRGPI